jgi:hypothetical protein
VIKNNLVYANSAHGLQMAGYPWEGSFHYKPKSDTAPDPSYAGAAGWLIANNTFAYNGAAAIVVWQRDAVNSRMVNNIFYENGVNNRSRTANGINFLVGNGGKGHIIENNLFFASGSGATLPIANATESVHYTQSGNITANPDFSGAGATLSGVPDFHLKAGSPAIDQGLTLPQVTWDHDGGARPWPSGGTHDIGAYEHGSPPVGGNNSGANDR